MATTVKAIWQGEPKKTTTFSDVELYEVFSFDDSTFVRMPANMSTGTNAIWFCDRNAFHPCRFDATQPIELVNAEVTVRLTRKP